MRFTNYEAHVLASNFSGVGTDTWNSVEFSCLLFLGIAFTSKHPICSFPFIFVRHERGSEENSFEQKLSPTTGELAVVRRKCAMLLLSLPRRPLQHIFRVDKIILLLLTH